MGDLGQQLFEQAQLLNDAARQHIAIGREQAERAAKPKIDALAHIVAMADKYPDAMLPTPLMAAIEAGRRVL